VETGLVTASITLGLLAAVLLRGMITARGSGVVVPFAELPLTLQQRVAKRKLRLRCACLAFFILAAALLFAGLPRGCACIAALAGFACHCRACRLRRAYPARPPAAAAFFEGSAPQAKRKEVRKKLRLT
jgi:hypothetical protein